MCVCVCVCINRCWYKYCLGHIVKKIIHSLSEIQVQLMYYIWFLRQTISEFFLLQLQLARKSGKLCLKPPRLIASQQSSVVWPAACSSVGRSEPNPATESAPWAPEAAVRSGTHKLAPPPQRQASAHSRIHVTLPFSLSHWRPGPLPMVDSLQTALHP